MIDTGYIGRINFLSPTDKLLDGDLEYEVTSRTRITEIFVNGSQPFETIYTPLSLSNEIYKRDFINNVYILGIKSTMGTDIFYVPESYIGGPLDIIGVKYVEKVLAINIGKVPVDLSLDNLFFSLKELVKEKTNLDVEVAFITNSAVEIVDETDHIIYMNKINNLAAKEPTFKELYFELKEKYDNLWKITNNLNNAIKIDVIDKTV